MNNKKIIIIQLCVLSTVSSWTYIIFRLYSLKEENRQNRDKIKILEYINECCDNISKIRKTQSTTQEKQIRKLENQNKEYEERIKTLSKVSILKQRKIIQLNRSITMLTDPSKQTQKQIQTAQSIDKFTDGILDALYKDLNYQQTRGILTNKNKPQHRLYMLFVNYSLKPLLEGDTIFPDPHETASGDIDTNTNGVLMVCKSKLYINKDHVIYLIKKKLGEVSVAQMLNAASSLMPNEDDIVDTFAKSYLVKYC